MSTRKGKILIVDDDEYIRLSVQMFLEGHFAKVVSLADPGKIPRHLAEETFDVVLLDMNFRQGDTSGKTGLHWLKKILETDPHISVILITAYGGVNIAVQAIKEGAVDFIVKPWQNEKLLTTVLSAFRLTQSNKAVRHLKSQQQILASQMDQQFANIIGQSDPMKEVFTTIKKVAQTDANVLILGENGTGKELVARALHRASLRANEVFINVDLGAITETLFESELFGHVKGAFTDAKEDRIGRFEAAGGGTLFLDEIGNLSLPAQAKLLAVLQNRQIVRVGTHKPVEVDIRLICATNMPLKKMVAEGTFRQDLLYRINTVEINLPTLRERPEDIPLLTEHFLRIYCKKYQKPALRVPAYVVKKLQKYPWPGNVRELQHALERAVIMAEDRNLHAADFLFLTEEKEEDQAQTYNLEALEKWAIKTP